MPFVMHLLSPTNEQHGNAGQNRLHHQADLSGFAAPWRLTCSQFSCGTVG